MQRLLTIADSVVDNVHMSRRQKEEIRRELESHIWESIEELQGEGKADGEIVQMIEARFGQTQVIGELFNEAHQAFFSENRYRLAAQTAAVMGFCLDIFILLGGTEVIMKIWAIFLAIGSACAWYAAEISLKDKMRVTVALFCFLLLSAGQFVPLALGDDGLVLGVPCFAGSLCINLILLQPLLHVLLLLPVAYAACTLGYILSQKASSTRYTVLIPFTILVAGLLILGIGSWYVHWGSWLEILRSLISTSITGI